MLGAERSAAQEAQRRREELFGSYVSDHPELSVQTAQDALAWTRSYYVQQQFVADAMAAPRTQVQALRDAHRALRERLRWFSPAQALAAASERSAGSDATGYDRFLAAAEAHKQAWDEALFRPLLAARNLATAELDRLPRFEPAPSASAALPALALWLQLSLLAVVLWAGARWRVVSDAR